MPFDGWCIERTLFNKVCDILPHGSTILELGSGGGTEELCKKYRVYTIEHNTEWLNFAKEANYIYAPLKECFVEDLGVQQRWYDADVLKEQLPKRYDMIFIDGPPGSAGRGGFLQNIHLFNTDVMMIFDDYHRANERRLVKAVRDCIGRDFEVHHGDKKVAAIFYAA